MTRVAYLGPPGTFTEEALLSQPDLVDADLVAMRSMPDVLAGTSSGEVDFGFVALENSIEGSVTLVLDQLVFDYELLIQREERNRRHWAEATGKETTRLTSSKAIPGGASRF